MKREAAGNAALPLSTIIRRTIWVAMLPLVLLAIGMAYHEVRAIQRDMEAQAASVAENAVASIDNFSKSQIHALTVLAHSPLLQDETRWGEFHVEAMGFYRSFGAHVVVTDGKRPEQLLLSTRVPVGTPLPVLKTDKFRQAGPVILETGKPAVGDLFMGVIQREPLVGIGVPVPGKPLVVGTTVRNDVFQQIVDKVSLPTDWSLVLADSVGDTIASKGPSAVVAPAKQNVANSTLSPWKLTVGIPGVAYWEPVAEAAVLLIAAIVGVTLLGFLGGNLTGRRLGKSVARIAEGVGPFDVQEASEAHQKIAEAHKALRESEEQFRVLTQNLVSAVALVNERGEISIVNKAFLHLFDLAEDADILNVNSRDWSQWQVFDEAGRLLDVDEHPVRKAALTRAAVRDMLVAVQCPSCTDRKWMLVSTEPILDAEGNLQRLICTYHDITARKNAEQALRESEQRYAAIHDHAPFALGLMRSSDGIITDVNEAWEKFFVCPREKAIGKTSVEVGLASDPELRAKMYQEIQQKGSVRNWELPYRTLTGEDRVGSFNFDLIEIGGVKYHLGTAIDITERKQAEEKLRQSEQRFRLALKNSPVLVAMQDSHLVYQWAYNTRTRRPEDVVGKTDADLFAPEDLPSILEAKSKVLQTGQVVRKGQWLTSNGQRVFLDSYYEPVRDSGGKILGIRIAAVNLTEQKRAEEALSQSEERYRALFESMSEGFALHEIVTDEQGRPLDYRFIDANPAFEKMTGLKRADVLGKRVREILPDIEAHWIDSYGRVALTGEPVHFENYSADLEQWFAVYAYRPAPRQFAAVFTDITVRKRTEQALAKAHSQIQDIIDNTPDIVYAFDLQERFVMVNASLAALFNTTKEQMIGKRRHEFMPREDADWHETNDRQVLESGTILEFEEYSNLEDRSITWLTKKFPLRDPQGTIYAVAGISADISDRKQAADALHRLNEMLESKVLERTADLHAANQALERRASQLRELAGDLTTTEQRERKALAKLLHDGLQQYLVAARMRQSSLIEDLENHAAKKSAQEIEGLLSESINVSRSLAIELCPPALDGGIMSGLEWLSRFMARKHGLDVDLLVETGAPVLPENIKVFLFESVRELLLNVVKHSKTLAAKVHLKEDRQRLQVIVSDAGVGFDVVALERRDSGAGLGLFSIRERIGLVCGSVEIDSSPGMGARITITVPIANLDTAPPEIPPMCRFIDPSRPEPDSKVRILLADDHKVVREGLAQMLGAEKDFEIVGQAEDGNAAVELTGLLRPRVVLMDVGMPNMDGITATRIIAERHPEVRIIGLSFYRAEERAEEMIKAGAKLYVSKTAPAEDLKQAIRSCVIPRCTT